MEDSIKSAERARRGMVHIQEIQIQSANRPLPNQRIKMLSDPRNKENIQTFYITTGLTKERLS